jgi:hypothetical protein
MIGFILAVTGEAGDDHELWQLAGERIDWGHHVTYHARFYVGVGQ